MTSTAIVNRIENNNIYLMHMVDYGQKESTERAFWNIKKRDFQAENPKHLNLEIGEPVEYFIPEGKTILATFNVLILPLLSFILTYALLSIMGIPSEKLIALLSLGVMVLSFSINRLFKRLGIKETLPTIVEKVNKERLKEIQKGCKDCGSCTICG